MLRPREEQKEPMLGVTKVSEKGQVSIPFEMRQRLTLTKGTKLVAVATTRRSYLAKGRQPSDQSQAERSH
jgi:bifunctional DNA-binding transcriptional regulator/antitoxin component of YhaV-PrlF toxin-antitoxin module